MNQSSQIDDLQSALDEWKHAGGDLEAVVSWGMFISGAPARSADAPAPSVDELCSRLREIGQATGAVEALVVAGFIRITEALFEHLAENYGKSVASFRQAGRVLRAQGLASPNTDDDLTAQLAGAAEQLGTGDLTKLAGYQRMLVQWRALTAPLVDLDRLYESATTELIQRAASSRGDNEPVSNEPR